MKVCSRGLSTGLLILAFSFVPAFGGINYSRILDSNSGKTQITAITVDAAGNAYVAGFTTATDFPTTPGVVQPAIAPGTCPFVFDPHSPPLLLPCSDAIVAKLDASGNVIFATYLGGSGIDGAQAIAVDSQGAIYIAGQTVRRSQPQDPPGGALNNFPVTQGAAFRNESFNQPDAFVTKLNSTGTAVIYSTLIPGAGHGRVSLAVDASGNIYFGGVAMPGEGAFPPTSGAYQATPSSTHVHTVVAKLNPAGSALVYSTYVGGSLDDNFSDLALDSSGSVYITGQTQSSDYPVTAGPLRATPSGSGVSGFVSKLNASGNSLVYSSYVGGNGADAGRAIRVDASGNAFVLGSTTSTDFQTTTGAFQTTSDIGAWWRASLSSSRPFVLKLNPAGTGMVYSTFFDGAGSLALDSSGNAYIAGAAMYYFPVTVGATQRCAAGNFDAVAARLDSQGAIAAASYLGGSGEDSAAAIAVGGDGSVYLAGSTASRDFPGAAGSTTTRDFVVNLQISDPSKADTPCMALIAQNGASFSEGPVAPGELVTLRGLGFGPEQGVNPIYFPTQAAGVQVFFDGMAAPIVYAQSRQINVQVPWELAGQTSTQVQVVYQDISSNTATFDVSPVAPALFRSDYVSQVAAINQDGTPNSQTNPAKLGSYVSLFGTGGGPTDTPGVTGGIAPLSPLEHLTQSVQVIIGSTAVEVPFAGAAPLEISGVFQLNIRIPDTLPFQQSAWPITVLIGRKSDPVLPPKIWIQQ